LKPSFRRLVKKAVTPFVLGAYTTQKCTLQIGGQLFPPGQSVDLDRLPSNNSTVHVRRTTDKWCVRACVRACVSAALCVNLRRYKAIGSTARGRLGSLGV
jgi:hypothetical protein